MPYLGYVFGVWDSLCVLEDIIAINSFLFGFIEIAQFTGNFQWVVLMLGGGCKLVSVVGGGACHKFQFGMMLKLSSKLHVYKLSIMCH